MSPTNPDDTGDVEGPFCRCEATCEPRQNEGKTCWISGQAIPPDYFAEERAAEDKRDQARATGDGMPGGV